jgi:mono/diheme cytochrome c family protein
MHRLSSLVLFCALAFPAAAAAQNAAAVEHGKKVYAAEKCSICHSIGGVGNKKGALDTVGSKLTADEIREWIVSAPEMTKKTKAERKPLMRAYKLSKDDLDGLVAYLASLKK